MTQCLKWLRDNGNNLRNRDPLFAGAPRTTNSIPDIVNLRNRTGSVDMQRYMEWLRGHGYTFAGQN